MLWFRPRGPRTSGRSPLRTRPGVEGLEVRDLPATAVASLVASPAVLNPPNNRFVAVTVRGVVIESSPKARPAARFQVSDEYRRYEPSGPVTLVKRTPTVYDFQFTVVLQARRVQQDTAGRHYFVNVGSEDSQNANGRTVAILVPHNKLKPGQTVPTSSARLPSPKKGR